MLAVCTRARVMNLMGGYQPALNFLKHYLDLDPDNDTLWMVLADVHEYRENYRDAVEALEKSKHALLAATGPHVTDNLQFVNEKLQQLSKLA